MHENTMETTKAVLVSIDTGEFDAEQSLKELEELARTAEVEVAGTVTQRRDAPDSATCIGAGRLDEIKEFCEGNDVDLLIFDLELTATQTRNIERVTGVRAPPPLSSSTSSPSAPAPERGRFRSNSLSSATAFPALREWELSSLGSAAASVPAAQVKPNSKPTRGTSAAALHPLSRSSRSSKSAAK